MKDILAELYLLAEKVPSETIDHCAEKIAAHPRTFVYGAGRSGLMLRALAMRLAQMGRTAYVVGETTTPAIGEGDLLIVASASGKTHTAVHFAQTARSCGSELMILTATERSPLTELSGADALFSAPTKDSAAASQPMGSLFEQALLLFCDAVVRRLSADPAAMRRAHANLE